MAFAEFEVVAYSEEYLRGVLGDSHAVDYLRDYLRDIKAASIMLEGRYVDRHYLGDFSAYYSRSFSTPDTQCQRLHFFDSEVSTTKQALDAAYKDREAREASERLLNDRYLGFVVARPLRGARVGRTVLRTYPADGFRRFLAIRPYRVNLAGLRLRIEGLAYQQQDGGAAVCASTALWSAICASRRRTCGCTRRRGWPRCWRARGDATAAAPRAAGRALGARVGEGREAAQPATGAR